MKINKNKGRISMIVTSMLLLVSWVILLWISGWDRVIAAWMWLYSWIGNRVEYLSWMEIYNRDWEVNKKVLIKTVDRGWEINLEVEWAINANWLVIWGSNRWVKWNSVLWGINSRLDDGMYEEWWVNENVKYNVIIWWERNGNRANEMNNSLDLIDSVIIWWEWNVNSEWYKMWILGSKNTNVQEPKENDVVIGWEKEQIKGNKILVVWLGEASTDANKDNEAREENILLWNNIRPQHVENGYEGVKKIFVWNGSWEAKPNIGWWFYIYPKNGVWLNNENPKVMLDGSEAGWLLITWSDKKDIAELECDANIAWTITTVERGWWTAICGCDGEKWYALKEDPVSVYVCAWWVPGDDMAGEEDQWWELERDPSIPEWEPGRYCVVPTGMNKSTVVLYNGENWKPNTYWSAKWSPEANGWEWWWIWQKWTYGWVIGADGSTRECVYECAKWYYPNAENPIGWYQSSCIRCTAIANMYTWTWDSGWLNAWTAKDNCDYTCKAWYVYKGDKRICEEAPIWVYTLDGNQWEEKDCAIPIKVKYKVANLERGWVTTTIAQPQGEDPYFWKFLSNGTWEYACDYECAAGYIKKRDGTRWTYNNWDELRTKTGTSQHDFSWNLCISTPIWTYATWKTWTYIWCDNKWKNVIEIANGSIVVTGTKYAYYTSNSSKDSHSCEWKCEERMWLFKTSDGQNCTCWTGLHFDTAANKCVSNTKTESCGWKDNVPANAIKWVDRVVKTWNTSTKTWEVTYPANKNTSWVWQDTNAEWVGCAWSCPTWTVRQNNVCKVMVDAGWKCADTYNYNWIRLTNWLNGQSNLITETTFKSMTSSKFCEKWTVSNIKYFNTAANNSRWEWTWSCTDNGITVNCGTLQTRNAECDELVNWKNKEKWCKLVDTARAFQVAWIATGVQNLMSPTRNVKKWLEWNCLPQNDGNDIAHNSANNNGQVVCFTCETYYHRTYTSSTSKISNITAHHGSCTPDEYNISFDANSFRTIPYDTTRLWEEKYKWSNPNTVTSYNIDTNTITLWDASRAWYNFKWWTGWATDKHDWQSTPTKSLKIPLWSTWARIFYANWEAQTDIPYVVEHYIQKLDVNANTVPNADLESSYTLNSTQTFYWKPDEIITLANKKVSILWFTYSYWRALDVKWEWSWDKRTTTTILPNWKVSPNEKRVIKLYYTRNQYKLTYDHRTNCWTSSNKDVMYYYDAVICDTSKESAQKTISSTPAWVFVWWNKDKTATSAWAWTCWSNEAWNSNRMPATSKTVYAIYSKKITWRFYSNSLSDLQATREVTIYNCATEWTLPTAPAPTTLWYSWTAQWWSTNNNTCTRTYTNTQAITVSNDTNFYAIYTRPITFKSWVWWATSNSQTQCYYWAAARSVTQAWTPPSTNRLHEWKFRWWCNNSSSATCTTYNGESSTVTPAWNLSTLTFYGKYSRTVTFYSGKSWWTVNTQTQYYNADWSTNVTQSWTAPANASWSFIWWCHNSSSATCSVYNGTSTTVNPTYNIVPTFYGKFSRTITFKSWTSTSCSASNTQTQYYNKDWSTSVTQSWTVPSNQWWSFIWWCNNSTATGCTPYNGTSTTVNPAYDLTTLTFYGKFNRTVTFYSGKAWWTSNTQTQYFNCWTWPTSLTQSATVPANASWSFIWWCNNSSSATCTPYNGTSTTVTPAYDVVPTFYGKFNRTITFKSWVAWWTSNTQTQYYNKDWVTSVTQAWTAPSTTASHGWWFIWWCNNSSSATCTVANGTSTTVTPAYDLTTLTYYGKYSRTVTFYSGKSWWTSNTQTQYYNKDWSTSVTQTATVPADASWNFIWWCHNSTSATCTVYNGTSTTVNPTYNIVPTFYGKFSRTITFKSWAPTNQCSVSNTQTQYYNKDWATSVTQSATAPADSVWWNFIWWCNNSTSTGCTPYNGTSTTVTPAYDLKTLTFYGKFNRTVTFKSWTPTSCWTSNTQTQNYNCWAWTTDVTQSATVPANASWNFAWWCHNSTSNTCTVANWTSTTVNPAYNATPTYYGKFSRTITFKSWNAWWTTNTQTQTFNCATWWTPVTQAATLPDNTWWFIWWCNNSNSATCTTYNGTNKEVTPSYNLTTLTFYGKFSRTATFYSWISKWTTKTNTQYYNNWNYSVWIPAAPTDISWWTTLWWRWDTSATTSQYGKTWTITASNSTYYATYSRTLTMNFAWNWNTARPANGSVTSKTATQYYNTNPNITTMTVTLPSNGFTRYCYSFNWWSAWSVWWSHSWTPWVSEWASKTINAQWKINSYTVTVNKWTWISAVSWWWTYNCDSSVTIDATVKDWLYME